MQEFKSSGIFAYYSISNTSGELTFADAVFFFFFFFFFGSFFFFFFLLSLLVFFLPLYFLFENGIDTVFSLITSYLQLHRKLYRKFRHFMRILFLLQRVDQQNTFHRIGSNWWYLICLNIKLHLRYVRDRFWKPGK